MIVSQNKPAARFSLRVFGVLAAVGVGVAGAGLNESAAARTGPVLLAAIKAPPKPRPKEAAFPKPKVKPADEALPPTVQYLRPPPGVEPRRQNPAAYRPQDAGRVPPRPQDYTTPRDMSRQPRPDDYRPRAFQSEVRPAPEPNRATIYEMVEAPVTAPQETANDPIPDYSPADDPSEPRTQTLRSRLGATGGDIEVTELGGSTLGVGTLTGENALPTNMWENTTAALVKTLLPKVPVGTPSGAMDDLGRRLLLTAAAPPIGDGAEVELVPYRVERLYAAGLLDDAESLAAMASGNANDDRMMLALAKTGLLNGRVQDSCRVAARMRLTSPDPFWIKLRAYCYLLEDARPAAVLTANLLAEQGYEAPLFQELLKRLTGEITDTALPDKIFEAGMGPLETVMMRRLGLIPPLVVLKNADLAVVRTLALTRQRKPTRQSVTLQLYAAEFAERRGAIATEQLQQIYGSVPFNPDVRGGAMEYAKKNPGPWANALLFQTIRDEVSPAIAAARLRTAFESARQTEHYFTVARAHRDTLKNIYPRIDLAASAYEFAMAAVASGAYDTAAQWRNIAKDSALAAAAAGPGNGGPARAAQTRTLGALLRLARDHEELPWQPALAEGWTRAAAQGLVPKQQVVKELQLLDALGYELSPNARVWLVTTAEQETTGFLPSADMLKALETAAQNGRIGETVLLALIAIGPAGPENAHPLTLLKAISALSRVGLTADARRLALETLLISIPE